MNKERKLKYTKDQDLLESREVLTNLSKCKGLEKLLGLFLCLRFDGHFCVVQQIHLLHSMGSKPEAGILSFGWNPSTAQLLNLMRYLQTNFQECDQKILLSKLLPLALLPVLLNGEAACLVHNKVTWWRKVLLLLLDVLKRSSSGKLSRIIKSAHPSYTWKNDLERQAKKCLPLTSHEIHLFHGKLKQRELCDDPQQRFQPHCNLCLHYWKPQNPVFWRKANSLGAMW